MNKNFTIFAYLMASLIIIAFFAAGLEKAVQRVETKKSNIKIENILLQDENNNLKYAIGNCSQDSECIVTGCSEELCANQVSFSTCEVKNDVPNPNEYRCGCNQGLCSWIQK